MARHNRSTRKQAGRTQRSKILRTLVDAESRAYRVAQHSWIGEIR